MELEEKRAAFAKQGLNVAALSYDSQQVLSHFAERVGIHYPLLSDADSKTIKAFGILNETVKPGTPYYGVPYPGTYVIDSNGVVKSRYFEESYRDRYTAGTVLERVAPGAARDAADVKKAKHAQLKLAASDSTIRGGSRVTLTLELDLPENMHVYAPGVTGYIPVDWKIAESPLARAADAVYPDGKVMRLEAIRETVPVYEKKVRLTRDIVFAQEKELLAAQGSPVLKVEGSFRYQACDDKVCFPPETVPLEWTFELKRHDGTRVPPELRRRTPQ